MLRSTGILSVLLALSCDGLKCRCNSEYRRITGRVTGGLQGVITPCDNTNMCEVTMEACEADHGCMVMFNITRQYHHGQGVRPACLFEVDGQQGCHWYSGLSSYECDRTRGPVLGSAYNYRCMEGDFCNDVTTQEVNVICGNQ